MKIFKKIIIISAGVLAIWLVFNSIAFVGAKRGIVIDSVTKKPLQGIPLIRQTILSVPGIESTGQKRLSIVLAITDQAGRFQFPSFIKFKSPFNKLNHDYLEINPEQYRNEKDDLDRLTNNSGYFYETYGAGFSGKSAFTHSEPYKAQNHTYKPFNNEGVVDLSPIVSTLSECKNDATCLEMNIRSARNCIMISMRSEDSSCKDFTLKGTMIYKDGKSFGEDVSNDFAECNKQTDDTSAALCFANKIASSNAVVSDYICSTLSFETARNLCYFGITTLSVSKPLCSKITSKPIPDVIPLSALRHSYEGVIDYNTICIKERARKYGQ